MLSGEKIAAALHASRIVDLSVSNPHDPLGLAQAVATSRVTSVQPPRVHADFQNADAKGRLRLNCIGTIEDLARQMVQLRDGLVLELYSEDGDGHGKSSELSVYGIVKHSAEDQCWVALIDWNAIRRILAPRPLNDLGTDR